MDKINEKVDVISIYDSFRGTTMPCKMKWRGRVYRISKLDYHHKIREGRNLVHVFSVANDTMFFKLSFNTDNLQWTLLETYDAAGN